MLSKRPERNRGKTILNNVEVKEPRQYFLHSAHSSREWQPIWYYLRQARLSDEEGIELMRKEDASYRSHRDAVISRLAGKKSAYNINQGKPKQLVAAFARGEINDPVDISSAHKIALAVQGIPDGQKDASRFESVLLKCYDLSVGETSQHRNLRSAVFRAACRIDELLHGNK